MKAKLDLDVGGQTYATGLAPPQREALRRSKPGDLIAMAGDDESVGVDLETWCRLTGNPLLESGLQYGRPRWIFRYGAAPGPRPRATNSARSEGAGGERNLRHGRRAVCTRKYRRDFAFLFSVRSDHRVDERNAIRRAPRGDFARAAAGSHCFTNQRGQRYAGAA
jgi:hypothetical protein